VPVPEDTGPVENPPYIPLSDSDWQRTPLAAQALILSLWQRVEQLERVVEQQGARIAALEQELAHRQGRGRGAAQGSAATSAPSSGKRKRNRRSSGRSPGAQPGHEGHGRSLLPVERVDEVIAHKPSMCRQCGHRLSGVDPHPRRHQVTEVPPVRPRVTEYQLHTLCCPHCQVLSEAEWPPGVPRRAFGPRLQSWVGLLSGAYRLSKRNIVTLMGDAFGVNLSLGTVSQLEQEVSAAITAPVEAARAYVQQQPVVNIDETGWRERGTKAWLWTAVSASVTVFAIRRRRSREVVDELLGDDSTAIVGSDRFTAYGHLPLSRRQACWSHLQRTFEDFAARGHEAARVGQQLLGYTDQLFSWWHRIRDGTLPRATFEDYVNKLRPPLRLALWHGQHSADAATAATCGKLRTVEPALWTFVYHPGVEPTNNSAERALRHAVLWRHTSFGTHSPAGSRFAERMLTTRDTLRQQQRNVLDFLSSACQAALSHQPAPSLLPDTTP
jgi:transposase|tara:strand:- start:64 stop:1557 length:1494 start_codon:yes stop_codon:yes gene_type:complete